MSVFSEPINSTQRPDFAFCFNNPRFSDTILVFTTERERPATVSQRLVSTAANLWVSTAQAAASTVVAVSDGSIPGSTTVNSWLHIHGPAVTSWFQPRPPRDLIAVRSIHVNSALLAAASPFLKHLLEQAIPSSSSKLLKSAAGTSSRTWGSKRVIGVHLDVHQIPAAETVLQFIFTRELSLSSPHDALDTLVVAEQLQVSPTHQGASPCTACASSMLY
jgi:hypothetical protein